MVTKVPAAAAAIDTTYILRILFCIRVCVYCSYADADSISIDKMSHFMIEF